MDLSWKLAFQGGEEVDQLVGLVPARRVLVRSMNELLKHEVAPGMLLQRCFLQHLAKVFHIAVQVAHDHHFAYFLQAH